jgi:PAS domain-containing protein
MEVAHPVHLIPALPPPATAGSTRHNNQQLIFDFTKRKRWADLLITELTEVIMLVLSDTGVVWYCGPAVEDLLGWTDEEVVDMNFCEVMNGARIDQ